MIVPHVFLTRFNVPTNRVESSIYSESWLADRIRLFETYTLPSVRAQSTLARYWLVYLGADSPPWLRQYMSNLSDERLLRPVYLERPLSKAGIREDIVAVTGREGGPVITSNLDNDDGLATDYVDRLRGIEVDRAHAVLCLDEGLILAGSRVYHRVDRRNAFSAVLGDLGTPEFRSCWSEWHNRLHLVLPAFHGRGGPAWLQVVHGVNVSNRVRGRLALVEPYRYMFPDILRSVVDPSPKDVRRDRLILGPGRDVRDTVRASAARNGRNLLGTARYDKVRYLGTQGVHRLKPRFFRPDSTRR